MLVFLSLGTNQGDKLQNLQLCGQKIAGSIGQILKASSVYETASWGFDTEDKFFNQVLMVETALKAIELLDACLDIEMMLGRKRVLETGYQSRIIDVDILFYGEEIIRSEKLIVPHYLMCKRNFVLVPLNEIAPDWVHPIFKQPVSLLLSECDDKGEVIKVET
jgi:2-amino-4-hydroxy-6-hydroxymethyldihydropteridine diphosphokinase